METMRADGMAMPGGGTLTAFEPPSGPGVRTDTFGYAGYRTSPRFDSLLAKVIVHSPSPRLRRRRAARPTARCASSASRASPRTSRSCERCSRTPTFVAGRAVHALRRRPHRASWSRPRPSDRARAGSSSTPARMPRRRRRPAQPPPRSRPPRRRPHAPARRMDAGRPARGAGLRPGRPSARRQRRRPQSRGARRPAPAPDGTVAGRVAAAGHDRQRRGRRGRRVRRGQPLAVMEAMKMEHVDRRDGERHVRRIAVAARRHGLRRTRRCSSSRSARSAARRRGRGRGRRPRRTSAPTSPRCSTARATTLSTRTAPAAVARRHATGYRTARENIDDLFDPGTFVEYGPLVLAGQRAAPHHRGLIERTPARRHDHRRRHASTATSSTTRRPHRA